MIFDLDGVITKTATVHAAAWKKLFDWYLEKRQDKDFKPFDADEDYRRYVDGKPRYKGVKSFLESRGIELPYGSRKTIPTWKRCAGWEIRKTPSFAPKSGSRGWRSTTTALTCSTG